MTLTTGQIYDITTLEFTGWTGEDCNGYTVADYFRDGRYLGPDIHGVEPTFAEAE